METQRKTAWEQKKIKDNLSRKRRRGAGEGRKGEIERKLREEVS